MMRAFVFVGMLVTGGIALAQTAPVAAPAGTAPAAVPQGSTTTVTTTAPGAPPATTTITTTPKGTTVTTVAQSPGSKIVCQYTETLGTRLGGHKVCKTRDEWREDAIQQRQAVDHAQLKMGIKGN